MVLLAKRGSAETGQSQSLNGDQSGSQRAFQRTARTPGMDTIKGLALIATFIGVLIIFAMWVSLWENVWQASVVVQYTTLDSTALGLRRAFAHLGCGGGRRVVG